MSESGQRADRPLVSRTRRNRHPPPCPPLAAVSLQRRVTAVRQDRRKGAVKRHRTVRQMRRTGAVIGRPREPLAGDSPNQTEAVSLFLAVIRDQLAHFRVIFCGHSSMVSDSLVGTGG